MDSVICPKSESLVAVLGNYIGSFANVVLEDKKRYWIKISHINEFDGVFVRGYARSNDLIWTMNKESVGEVVHIQGIFVYDRGGDVRVFGNIERGSVSVVQTYTPFDRVGANVFGADTYINSFYNPDGTEVPYQVLTSYKG